jgi:predicted nucleic acid-binding Zn ribbon protein
MAIIPRPIRSYKLGPPKSDARQRVLAQWRGVDLAPIEKARTLRVKTAADALPGVMKELRLDRRRSEAEVLKVWNNLIDPTLVAHAQPTGLHKGTLFVTVDSSVWLNEIVRYRRKEILDRLQHSFGRELIVKISFRVG